MNIADMEIDLSNIGIKHKTKMIKRHFWSINLYGSLLIFLIITGYYLHGYNWWNGFAIGFNFMAVMNNILERSIAKSELELEELRLEFYTKLKDKI
jgi:hypothetical protein